MADELLDDFGDVSGWSAVASGQARLALARDAGPDGRAALRLDFDFRGGGGFVVARKAFPRPLPPAWALALRVRGEAPANKLEIKLADPSSRNVWWWHRDAFALPADWEALRIRSSEIEFAWGPAGGGAPRELGALEVAIAAGPGGAGTVWIADLRFEDLSLAGPPRVSASSAVPGHAPAQRARRVAGDELAERRRRAAVARARLRPRARVRRPRRRLGLRRRRRARFEVQASDDGAAWSTRWTRGPGRGPTAATCTSRAAAARATSASCSHEPADGRRRVRHRARSTSGRSSSRARSRTSSPPSRRTSRAACIRAGSHREQSYWTPVGVAGGTTCAILNEEGLVEVDRGSFSLEPFLWSTASSSPGPTPRSRSRSRRTRCRSRRRCGAPARSC